MENFELRPSGLWVPTDYTQPKSYLNWTEQQQLQQQLIARQNAIISKTPDGLGKGEPNYRCYTRAQAESMANRLLGMQNPTNSVFTPTSSTPLTTQTTPVAPQTTTSTKPKYRSNYAQEHGTVYHKPPKSGVVRADEIAAQRIAENAAKPQATAVQPQVTNSTPVATPEPTVRKPYVKPTVAPASDVAKSAVMQEALNPTNDIFFGEQTNGMFDEQANSITGEQATNGSRRVKTPEQRAEQLRRIRSNPKAKAKYNNMKLKNNPELASRYESFCQTAKKAGKMKGLKKAGKWGALAALAIGAIGLTVKACSGDKKDETIKPETETQKPETPKDNKATNPTTPPASTAEPAPATETPEPPVNQTEEPAEPSIGEFKDGKYKVKKGDSFWEIAEQNLINEYKKAQEAKGETVDETYKPTDAEILKETERLVEKNEYQFDEKHWNTTKPIYEGDILNIAA